MGTQSVTQSAAVLGTGIMGAAMARNLAASGIATAAWNRSHQRALPLAQDGVEVFADPCEAVRGRDAVFTVLPDAEVVRAVMSDGVLDAMAEHAVWIQSSTVGIEGIDQLIALAAEAQVRLLDAPVSGTKAPAEAGRLVILASGEEAAAIFCRPLLEAIGAKTVWLGQAGNGSRMKLVANDWVLGQTALVAEVLHLCEGLGLRPECFLESIDGAPVSSPYATTKAQLMIEGEFDPNFPLEHGAKDARLILSAAADAGLDLPLSAATSELFQAALAAGEGKRDVAAVYLHSAR